MKEEIKKEFKCVYILIFALYVCMGIVAFVFIYGGSIIDIIGENDFVFECNPHYFGPQYSYPNPICNDTFINVTGNYCNGKLVCENQLR